MAFRVLFLSALLWFATVGCASTPVMPPPQKTPVGAGEGPRPSATVAETPAPSAPTAPRLSDTELTERAEAAYKAGDWKSAEPAYRELVRRAPAAANPHRGLGVALANLGKLDEAIAELERSVAIEDSAQARYNIGICYGKKKDFGRAAVSLRLAVGLNPDYPQAWSNLVDALAMSQRDADAVDAVKEARAKCRQCGPGSEFTRSNHAFAVYFQDKATRFLNEGKLDMAEAAEKVALTVDPDFADAYSNLGKIAVARGKTDVGEFMYRKALAHYRPEEASLAADAKNNLASLLVGKGAGREAASLAREAIAVRGERPSYLDTLGRACEVANDRPCARAAYHKLLANAGPDLPADVTAHARERLAHLESTTP